MPFLPSWSQSFPSGLLITSGEPRCLLTAFSICALRRATLSDLINGNAALSAEMTLRIENDLISSSVSGRAQIIRPIIRR